MEASARRRSLPAPTNEVRAEAEVADVIALPVADVDVDVALRDVAAGDEVAFAALYDRLVPSIYCLAQLVLGRGSGAEEAVRATFVELWTRAPEPGFARGRSIESWTLSTVHRLAVAMRTADPASAVTRPSSATSPAHLGGGRLIATEASAGWAG